MTDATRPDAAAVEALAQALDAAFAPAGIGPLPAVGPRTLAERVVANLPAGWSLRKGPDMTEAFINLGTWAAQVMTLAGGFDGRTDPPEPEELVAAIRERSLHRSEPPTADEAMVECEERLASSRRLVDALQAELAQASLRRSEALHGLAATPAVDEALVERVAQNLYADNFTEAFTGNRDWNDADRDWYRDYARRILAGSDQ